MSNPETISGHGSDTPGKQEVKKEIIEFVKMIAWFLILFFLVTSYVLEGYEVQGPSMDPTLMDRERIFVLKLPHVLTRFSLFSSLDALKPGDVVVFDSPIEKNKRYVKRLIAKGPNRAAAKTVSALTEDGQPGSGSPKVRFDHGSVYVNDKRIDEGYLQPEQRECDDSYGEVRLGPGSYYLLGDNRNVSKDSRRFGPVDDSYIIGKAFVCFWPPSHIRLIR